MYQLQVTTRIADFRLFAAENSAEIMWQKENEHFENIKYYIPYNIKPISGASYITNIAYCISLSERPYHPSTNSTGKRELIIFEFPFDIIHIIYVCNVRNTYIYSYFERQQNMFFEVYNVYLIVCVCVLSVQCPPKLWTQQRS